MGIFLAGFGLMLQAQQPEAFSPAGKAFFARPDAAGVVQKADLALAKNGGAEALLEAARVRDGLLRFSESIPLYSRGMDEYPDDVRFPRFRGHRFLSTRRFDSAIADLKKASAMAPASFDVSYHLGLAYYLRGDYNHAAREYGRCLEMAALPRPDFLKGMPAGWRSCHGMDDDSRVALTEWAWRANRRAGKPDEAARMLGGISESMTVKENGSYLRTLLLYKGLRSVEATLLSPGEGNAAATVGYGVGLWQWFGGKKDEACQTWARVASDANWAAFGVIAAEREAGCRPAKKK
ncbi:MAG: tetratricopeptide repeat protein [Acidobacteria bacterium]|nr:tetratricopeptide repeat protein [Acidobacteriota bacterium]